MVLGCSCYTATDSSAELKVHVQGSPTSETVRLGTAVHRADVDAATGSVRAEQGTPSVARRLGRTGRKPHAYAEKWSAWSLNSKAAPSQCLDGCWGVSSTATLNPSSDVNSQTAVDCFRYVANSLSLSLSRSTIYSYRSQVLSHEF